MTCVLEPSDEGSSEPGARPACRRGRTGLGQAELGPGSSHFSPALSDQSQTWQGPDTEIPRITSGEVKLAPMGMWRESQ